MQESKTCEISELILMIICGIASALTIVGVAGGRNWSDGGHKGGIWGHSDDYANR